MWYYCGSSFYFCGFNTSKNSNANQLITVANAADVTLGTMTLADGEVTFIMKDPTDQIFAAAATVLGTPVKYS